MNFLKSDRGATVAEYAVVLAVFGMGMWGAGQVLQRATTVALSGSLATVNSSGAGGGASTGGTGNTGNTQTGNSGNTQTGNSGNTQTGNSGNTQTDPDCKGNGKKKC